MNQLSIDLIKYMKFLHQFQEVERSIWLQKNKSPRNENDSEHSYQLAMVGWYLAEKLNRKLDVNKIIKYALVHDLVEVYAGDISMYNSAEKTLETTKQQRELAAIEKIKVEFADFPEQIKMIMEYENKGDPESKFVYALDKLIAQVNITEIHNMTQAEAGGTKEDFNSYCTQKIKKSDPDIYKILIDLQSNWEKDKNFYLIKN